LKEILDCLFLEIASNLVGEHSHSKKELGGLTNTARYLKAHESANPAIRVDLLPLELTLTDDIIAAQGAYPKCIGILVTTISNEPRTKGSTTPWV
jgi:hypothetical protein